MRRFLFASVCLLALPIFGFAQNSEFHHNNFVVGLGPAIPLGSSSTYLGTAPLFKVAYGYRLTPLFQADAGLDIAFGAAHNQNAVITDIGTVTGGDREYMIPLGGRIILPLPFHRFEASAGGGVYLHYSETAPSGGGYYSINCYSCTSRSGWGGYGLGNVSYFLDENHNFRVGSTFQYIVGSTNGQAVANFPALKTTDHWAILSFEFGLSF